MFLTFDVLRFVSIMLYTNVNHTYFAVKFAKNR